MHPKLATRSALSVAAVWLVTVAPAAGSAAPAVAAPTPAAYSRDVSGVCSHALLVEGRHSIGTRPGALAVARDIRASTARRLARVTALPAPAAEAVTVARWIGVERRLADMYARTYLRIYDAISTQGTKAQHDRAVRSVRGLLDAPQALREDAGRLELQLRVPDCTGGQ